MTPQAKAGLLAVMIMIIMSALTMIVAWSAYKMINAKKPKTKKDLVDECLRNNSWVCVHEVSLLTGLEEKEVGTILALDPNLIEQPTGCIRGSKRTRLFKRAE